MRLGIVGLGLIGGSLGLAVRAARPDVEVLGVARREETAAEAVRIGAAARAGTGMAALRDADVVVVAVPLGATDAVLAELAGALGEGVAVTDVGSVKASVVASARRHLDPRRNPFLGGHPMAGKEVGGIENAEAGLFVGRPWVFTPTDGVATKGAAAVGRLPGFREVVADIGAVVQEMTPEEHDRRVALVSHLPFMLSATYLLAAGGAADWPGAAPLASSGFRDISRLGAGDPAMYAAIVEANLPAIREAWEAMSLALAELESAFERGEHRHLLELFVRARQVRQGWEAGRK
ncbi:MAG TPA: prephenate dehydrogenase/arogenate dehydrogenase family protein [Candidatus Dormibacteraeota bacterium]|jgi:prephenate dehydrogenase|nr:prephenate dehydrogenase/arogenate dehydrogenase family protein [Candidatus Dormibacteraeota bacterium]